MGWGFEFTVAILPELLIHITLSPAFMVIVLGENPVSESVTSVSLAVGLCDSSWVVSGVGVLSDVVLGTTGTAVGAFDLLIRRNPPPTTTRINTATSATITLEFICKILTQRDFYCNLHLNLKNRRFPKRRENIKGSNA